MSTAGFCIAASTKSGMLVGPGIDRNSRPAATLIEIPQVSRGKARWRTRNSGTPVRLARWAAGLNTENGHETLVSAPDGDRGVHRLRAGLTGAGARGCAGRRRAHRRAASPQGRGADHREGSARQARVPLGERAGDGTRRLIADRDATEVRLG